MLHLSADLNIYISKKWISNQINKSKKIFPEKKERKKERKFPSGVSILIIIFIGYL